jgi:hypothetical protein
MGYAQYAAFASSKAGYQVSKCHYVVRDYSLVHNAGFPVRKAGVLFFMAVGNYLINS